jgi:hypothetical protein
MVFCQGTFMKFYSIDDGNDTAILLQEMNAQQITVRAFITQ